MMLPLAGWGYCKPMTVRTTYLDANLTGYPSIVRITADSAIGAACLANGYDIRFTKSDGTTLLSYERVSFSVTGGAATGIFWVNVDHTTSPATQIYCHYGNAAAPDVSNPALTWTAYTRRWSLREAYSTAAGNYKDSLGVGNLTLTDADGDSGQGVGPIDYAVDLNGDADYLTDADHADHDPGGAMTVEAWINHDVFVSLSGYVHHPEAAGYLSWCLRSLDNYGGTAQLYFQIKTASGYSDATGGTQLSTGKVYYCVGVFDKSLGSNRLKVYLHGVLDGQGNSYAEDIVDGINGINVGAYKDVNAGSTYLNGKEAEVRYSKDAKSAAWIKFTNFSILSADGEWDWGAEVAAPSGDIFLFGANC
jgi:hypothetical protein